MHLSLLSSLLKWSLSIICYLEDWFLIPFCRKRKASLFFTFSVYYSSLFHFVRVLSKWFLFLWMIRTEASAFLCCNSCQGKFEWQCYIMTFTVQMGLFEKTCLNFFLLICTCDTPVPTHPYTAPCKHTVPQCTCGSQKTASTVFSLDFASKASSVILFLSCCVSTLDGPWASRWLLTFLPTAYYTADS